VTASVRRPKKAAEPARSPSKSATDIGHVSSEKIFGSTLVVGLDNSHDIFHIEGFSYTEATE